jgi:hypothetical protein
MRRGGEKPHDFDVARLVKAKSSIPLNRDTRIALPIVNYSSNYYLNLNKKLRWP